MDSFRMRFIVGKLTDEELQALRDGKVVISKMLLLPDDYKVFHYKEGDDIEAETPEGNRIWTTIRHMEIVSDDERVIVILSLLHKPMSQPPTAI